MTFAKKVLYTLKQGLQASIPFSFEPESREFNENKTIILYRCSVCGYKSKSVGYLHGHMEAHTPWWSIANVSKFMDWTEKLVITDYEVTDVEEFEELNV